MAALGVWWTPSFIVIARMKLSRSTSSASSSIKGFQCLVINRHQTCPSLLNICWVFPNSFSCNPGSGGDQSSIWSYVLSNTFGLPERFSLLTWSLIDNHPNDWNSLHVGLGGVESSSQSSSSRMSWRIALPLISWCPNGKHVIPFSLCISCHRSNWVIRCLSRLSAVGGSLNQFGCWAFWMIDLWAEPDGTVHDLVSFELIG